MTLEEQTHDPVNHPKHYTSDPSGVECIQITRHRNFNVGNAIKYLWRAGLKDDTRHIEDLRKAVWYIEDEIARLETIEQKRPRINLHVGTPATAPSAVDDAARRVRDLELAG